MESRIHGDVQVRFGGRLIKTYHRKTARRYLPSLQITNEKISRDMAALTDRIGDKYQVETNRPKSDFRNIGKVGKRKKSML